MSPYPSLMHKFAQPVYVNEAERKIRAFSHDSEPFRADIESAKRQLFSFAYHYFSVI